MTQHRGKKVTKQEIIETGLIGYMKEIVAERGITEDQMTKDLMKEVLAEAHQRAHRMVDTMLDSVGTERYQAGMEYMAAKTYQAIPSAF